MNYVDTLRTEIETMTKGFVQLLPSLAIALIIVLITYALAKSAARITDRLTKRTSMREDLVQLIDTLTGLMIWLVGITIALTVAIPSFTPAGAFAGLGVGALAVGFAFQDILENFLAGVFLMLRDKMNIGDLIEVEGILGKVENTILRETHIRQFTGELTILPNSMVFKNPVKIITDVVVRRNEVVIGVSYDTDLQKAEAAIRKAMDSLESLHQGKSVDVFAQEFNSSSIDFLVRWWTDTSKHDFLGVKSKVIFAIKQALDEAEIEIPFPYITHTFKEAVPLLSEHKDAA